MKIKSLIVSLIATLVVFGTVSFAAEYDISLDPVIEYTAGTGYVEVKLVADETVTSVVGSSTARINFDSTVFELDSANTTTIAPSTVVMPQGVTAYAQWSSQDGIASMAGGTLANIRFNVKDGQEANVVGKEFYISLMVGNKSFDRSVTYTVGKNIKVAVTAAAPAGTSTKTVYAEETYALSNETFDFGSAYNFANKYNVVVKYNNAETKTYGWSWKNNLGIEGEGTVTGKVKFGVKISDTSKYDATLFTFDLVEVQ